MEMFECGFKTVVLEVKHVLLKHGFGSFTLENTSKDSKLGLTLLEISQMMSSSINDSTLQLSSVQFSSVR